MISAQALPDMRVISSCLNRELCSSRVKERDWLPLGADTKAVISRPSLRRTTSLAAVDCLPLAASTCGSISIFSLSSIAPRSEEHTSELQSLMRISYAVFCLKKKKTIKYQHI